MSSRRLTTISRIAALLRSAALTTLLVGAAQGQLFERVATEGDAAPGLSNRTFKEFAAPFINRYGSMTFRSVLEVSGDNPNEDAIWLWDGSSLTLVAKDNTTPPTGFSSAWKFHGLSAYPSIDSNNTIAFVADVYNAGTDTTVQTIWMYHGGTLKLIAKQGDAAPDEAGSPSADYFVKLTRSNCSRFDGFLTRVMVSDHDADPGNDTVLFHASLGDTEGLFLFDSTGFGRRIIAEAGTWLPTINSDDPTIGAPIDLENAFGEYFDINKSGEAIFHAELDSGTRHYLWSDLDGTQQVVFVDSEVSTRGVSRIRISDGGAKSWATESGGGTSTADRSYWSNDNGATRTLVAMSGQEAPGIDPVNHLYNFSYRTAATPYRGPSLLLNSGGDGLFSFGFNYSTDRRTAFWITTSLDSTPSYTLTGEEGQTRWSDAPTAFHTFAPDWSEVAGVFVPVMSAMNDRPDRQEAVFVDLDEDGGGATDKALMYFKRGSSYSWHEQLVFKMANSITTSDSSTWTLGHFLIGAQDERKVLATVACDGMYETDPVRACLSETTGNGYGLFNCLRQTPVLAKLTPDESGPAVAAILRVTTSNPTDVDDNGLVELEDFFAFFACFDENGSCADLNCDGTVDLLDYFAFFQYFELGDF